MPTRPRVRFSVRWSASGWTWEILSGKSEFEGIEDRKAEAVARAREMAKAGAAKGAAVELWIYKRNGQIQDRRSFWNGSDPRRSRG